MSYCTHDDCRAHSIEDMLFFAKRLGRPNLTLLAAKLHASNQEVRCRRVPNKRPPIQPPFAGEES